MATFLSLCKVSSSDITRNVPVCPWADGSVMLLVLLDLTMIVVVMLLDLTMIVEAISMLRVLLDLTTIVVT